MRKSKARQTLKGKAVPGVLRSGLLAISLVVTALYTEPHALAQVANERGGEVWVQAGRVLAEPGKGYLSQRTLVIRSGQIVEILEGYKDPAGDGALVIDLRDAYVLPGLIDCHVHLTFQSSPTSRFEVLTDSESLVALKGAANARKTLLAGFTTVQDLGGSTEAIMALRDAVNQGLLAGPRIRASGRAITPTGGHADNNGFAPRIRAALEDVNDCNGADDCRRAVREAVKAGADVIKITATGGVLSNTAAGLGQQLFDDELEAIVETATSMGRKVTAHAHGKDGIDAALRAGVSGIEHGTDIGEETIRLFRRSGATLVPTALAAATVTGWSTEDWLPAASRVKAAEVGPKRLETLRRARKGGVKIAFGTDSGVSPHGENAREFALMVQAEFTPEEAIRAATIIAAEHLDLSSTVGRLAPGFAADIIALDTDPLLDVRALESVDFVMKGGVIYRLMP